MAYAGPRTPIPCEVDGEGLARAAGLRLGVIREGRMTLHTGDRRVEGGRGTVFLLPARPAGAVTTDAAFSAEILVIPSRAPAGEVADSLRMLPAGRATAALYGRIRRLVLCRRLPPGELDDILAAIAAADLRPAPALTPALQDRIHAACEHLNRNFAAPYVLQPLAARAGLSPWHFIRTFHSELGEAPRQYLLGVRLRRAADLLLETDDRITDVALAAGFADISHFNATFRKAFGVSPGQWRPTEI